MSGVVEFLLARLDDEETEARALSGEEWFPIEVPGMSMRKRPDEPTEWVVDSGPSSIATCSVNKGEEIAQFMVSHDPARVLADVAAKRRIVGMLKACANDGSHTSAGALLEVVRTLATAYSSHPDYDKAWRP